MKVILSQVELLRRVIILNEIVAFFLIVFPSYASIEKQVKALNEGDCGL